MWLALTLVIHPWFMVMRHCYRVHTTQDRQMDGQLSLPNTWNLLHLCDSYQKPTFSSTVDSARNWIMVMFIHLFLFWIYYSSPFKISIILYHGSVVRKSGWLPEGGNLMKLFDNLIFLLSCKYFPMQSLYYPGPTYTGTHRYALYLNDVDPIILKWLGFLFFMMDCL